jgi:hypothetical protein
MAFRDLEEGIPTLFDEARRDGAFDNEAIRAGSLSLDTRTVRDFAHEANYIAEARLAPGITRWHCPNCGEEMELRPGLTRPIHMGAPKARLPLCHTARCDAPMTRAS